jgi:hypothetical protein
MFRRLLLAVALPLSLLSVASCNTAPTLPLPPPVANVSLPSSAGLVIVEGMAKSRATMFLYNEQAEAGVIGRADEAGSFVLAIEAMSGDSLTLWQEHSGTPGQQRTLTVPTPRTP